MRNKILPIIIIAIVLIAVIFFIFSLNSGEESKEALKQKTGSKLILNLALSTIEEDQEKVTILAKAMMEDGSKIEKIILPDDSEILAAEAAYISTENGEYTFMAIAENGEQSSATITVSNIKVVSANTPYIPNGFSHVEGTEVETGYVIEDTYGNQYVWVPLTNGQSDLVRETVSDSKYQESDSTASALVNSAGQNYGFYVARYESSEYELNGEKVPATMSGKAPWTNITYKEAAEYTNNVASKYGYEDITVAMMNSYAWDTILKWFDEKVENYSTNINYGNYSGAIYPTGATETDIVYNICDIAGNVREWTTEIYKEESTNSNRNEELIYRVVRGGSASLSRTPKSHTGYPEDTFEEYWGFRMILYK